ncbi:hypothetical protein COCOBI_pt-2180 (chloroplast) [Coccomyxa sp. Obi]|nr:hypothetical protein COCOBI_pt-2180 [Coccomyxa sp. Obi]
MLGSRALSQLTIEPYFYCCGIGQGYEIRAAGVLPHFDIPTATATAKGKEWNKGLARLLPAEHKPLPLPDNLDDQVNRENGNKIFNAAKPLYVFSNQGQEKERITNHVDKLKALEAESSQPVTPTGKGKKRATDFRLGTLYDSSTLIFDDTIEAGYYIEAGTFMTHYKQKEKRVKAVDNRNHKVIPVSMGEARDGEITEGLVSPETSLRHRSTRDPESTTHGDLYLRKGKYWACVGDMSLNTGKAREPNKDTKLDRTATTRR